MAGQQTTNLECVGKKIIAYSLELDSKRLVMKLLKKELGDVHIADHKHLQFGQSRGEDKHEEEDDNGEPTPMSRPNFITHLVKFNSFSY